MKVKVAEASGVVLDWLVAKCEGADNLRRNVHRFNNDWILDWPRDQEGKTPRVEYLAEFSPTNSWAQGGPIIEREFIHWGMTAVPHGATPTIYLAYQYQSGTKPVKGTTPLVAAMRCLVTSRLGEEVEVPDELFQEE